MQNVIFIGFLPLYGQLKAVFLIEELATMTVAGWLFRKSIVFSHSTLVPTPGRVRSASRACTYGTVRRPSSHSVPWVSRICFALCCRNRALYPKPRSLRCASTLLPANYNVIIQHRVIACMYFCWTSWILMKVASQLLTRIKVHFDVNDNIEILRDPCITSIPVTF